MTDINQPTSSAPVPAAGSPPGAVTASDGPGGAEKAKQVAGTAASGATEVAQQAKEQAAGVAQQATEQAKDVLHDVRRDVRRQADEQAGRGGEALRQLGSQLQALRDGDVDRAGPVAGYAAQLQEKVEGIAGRIEAGGLDGILDDVRDVARRRPAAFLFGAAVAGFAVGRLVRSSTGSSSNGGGPSGGSGRYVMSGTVPATSPTIPPASPDLLTNPLAQPTGRPVGTTPPLQPTPVPPATVHPTDLADARPPIGPS